MSDSLVTSHVLKHLGELAILRDRLAATIAAADAWLVSQWGQEWHDKDRADAWRRFGVHEIEAHACIVAGRMFWGPRGWA